jgi:hypothetical protein
MTDVVRVPVGVSVVDQGLLGMNAVGVIGIRIITVGQITLPERSWGHHHADEHDETRDNQQSAHAESPSERTIFHNVSPNDDVLANKVTVVRNHDEQSG